MLRTSYVEKLFEDYDYNDTKIEFSNLGKAEKFAVAVNNFVYYVKNAGIIEMYSQELGFQVPMIMELISRSNADDLEELHDMLYDFEMRYADVFDQVEVTEVRISGNNIDEFLYEDDFETLNKVEQICEDYLFNAIAR